MTINDVKYSKIIPFKSFLLLNLYGTIFINKANKQTWKKYPRYVKNRMINHEYIHELQALDYCKIKWIGYTIFYLVYFFQWIIQIILPPYNSAYKDIPFEKEAKMFQNDLDYYKTRKRFAWKHLK